MGHICYMLGLGKAPCKSSFILDRTYISDQNVLIKYFKWQFFCLKPLPGLGVGQIPWLSAHDCMIVQNLQWQRSVDTCRLTWPIRIRISQLRFTRLASIMCILSLFMYLDINYMQCKLKNPKKKVISQSTFKRSSCS